MLFHFLLLLYSLAPLSQCTLTPALTYACNSNSPSCRLFSLDFMPLGMIGLMRENSTFYTVLARRVNNTIVEEKKVMLGVNANDRIRGYQYNNGTATDAYVMYNKANNVIGTWTNNFTNYTPINFQLAMEGLLTGLLGGLVSLLGLAGSQYNSILEAKFSHSRDRVFVASYYTGNGGPRYYILQFANGNLIQSCSIDRPSTSTLFFSQLNLQVLSPSTSTLFLTLSTFTLVFDSSALPSPLLRNHSYPQTAPQSAHLISNTTTYSLALNSIISIYDMNNQTLLQQIAPVMTNIRQVYDDGGCYVYVLSGVTVWQYDSCVGAAIGEYAVGTGYVAMVGAWDGVAVWNGETAGNTGVMLLGWGWEYEAVYPADCYAGYGYVQANGTCVRGYVAPPVNTTPVPTPSPADPTVDPTEPTPQPSISQQVVQFLNTSAIHTTLTTLSSALTFTSFRFAPRFLASLSCFLDDIWFYKYHNYTYPQIVVFFTEEIDIMNELRLKPWFLDQLDVINEAMVCLDENARELERRDQGENGVETVYFLNAAEDTYKGNMVMNVGMWLGFRAVYYLLAKIHKTCTRNSGRRCQFLLGVVSQLQYTTQWWNPLQAVLEANMLKLSFNVFIQLINPSSLNIIDKLNLLATFACLLLLLLYSLCFYPLLYVSQPQPYTQPLLTKSSYSLRSFYFQCFYFLTRNLFRAFAHAYFIKEHHTQMIVLLLIDLFYLGVVVRMRRCFRGRVVAWFTIGYALVFCGFDGFWVLRGMGMGEPEEGDVALGMLMGLIVLALGVAVGLAVESVQELKEQIAEVCQSNRVDEETKPPAKGNIYKLHQVTPAKTTFVIHVQSNGEKAVDEPQIGQQQKNNESNQNLPNHSLQSPGSQAIMSKVGMSQRKIKKKHLFTRFVTNNEQLAFSQKRQL